MYDVSKEKFYAQQLIECEDVEHQKYRINYEIFQLLESLSKKWTKKGNDWIFQFLFKGNCIFFVNLHQN